MKNDNGKCFLLVTLRARMLASAHSVSENGAPAAGLYSSQKARLTMALARRSAAFKRALHCFDNQVGNDARFAVDGMRRARLCLRLIYLRAANESRRPQGRESDHGHPVR